MLNVSVKINPLLICYYQIILNHSLSYCHYTHICLPHYGIYIAKPNPLKTYMTVKVTTNSPGIILLSQGCNVKCSQTTCLEANMSQKRLVPTRLLHTHTNCLCSDCLNDYPPFQVQHNSSRSLS